MAFLRRPFVWIPLLLVLLSGTALLAAHWLVPGVVRSQGQAWVDKNLPGKQLTMGAIGFDPLALDLDIRDIAIADGKTPAAPMVAVGHLNIDASLASLWHLAPRLDAVTIEAPVVDAVLRKDGSLNLIELVPPDDGTPLPEVWIGDLTVAGGIIDFTDQRRAAATHKRLTPVTFALKDFATTATTGGGFKFAAASEEGERFAWNGTLGLTPLASTGDFRIDRLQLATIGRLAGDLLPVGLEAGGVDVAGHYRFATPPRKTTEFDGELTTLALHDAVLTASTGDRIGIRQLTVAPTRASLADDAVALGAVAIDGITIARPGGERAAVAGLTLGATRYGLKAGVAEIGAAAVRGITVTGRGKDAETVALDGVTVAPSRIELTPHSAAIGLVTATGLRGRARIGADNSISVAGIWPMVPPNAASATMAGPAWQARLAGFALDDAAIHLDVARPAPIKPAGFDLAPLSARVGGVTSALDAPLAVEFSTGIDGKAKIAVNGTISPRTLAADLAIDARDLPLAAAAALTPPSPVLVRSGLLSAKGRLRFVNAKAGPAPEFAGQVGVSQLDLVQRSDNSPLLTWRQLDMTGIDYHGAPQRLAIARIAFDGAQSHVIITREAKLNVATVAGVDTPSTSEPGPAAAKAPTPAVVVAATPAPQRRQLRISAPVSGGLNAAGKMFPVTIGAITVKASSIAFEDHSIEPDFAARIDGFHGSVTGLSTAPGSQAKFQLDGYVIDRFAPVTIIGRANPFAYDANTDLTAKFTNIELPVFNPYSGRFAGYAIAKGKLSTTIHYRIVNRALDAQHNIVIDQLVWGEATDSKQKVSLPVRLATSLLKDKNGVIDLDLPVEGTLDDPKFKIWPLVWKVVGNVLTKIVTAPFALIGSLFEGGDKAQFVAFAPGSATLPSEAGKSLAALAKGLAEKPEVNLDIPAGPGIREDAEALTTEKLHAAAAKKGEDFAALDDGKKADRLKSLYKAKFGKGPKFPEGEVAKAGMFAKGDAKAAANTDEVEWLEAQLRPKFAPSDAELAALGQARAAAVKEALLGDGSLTPTRVFISTAAGVKAKGETVEMELAVK